MTYDIKNTKIALILVPVCWGNSNQCGKSVNFDGPISMMPEAQGMDLIDNENQNLTIAHRRQGGSQPEAGRLSTRHLDWVLPTIRMLSY